MTFFQTIKKLFSPVKDDPIAFIQNIAEALGVAAYTIFSIEIMKAILNTIEKDIENTGAFLFLISIYLGVSIVAIGLRFTILHW